MCDSEARFGVGSREALKFGAVRIFFRSENVGDMGDMGDMSDMGDIGDICMRSWSVVVGLDTGGACMRV